MHHGVTQDMTVLLQKLIFAVRAPNMVLKNQSLTAHKNTGFGFLQQKRLCGVSTDRLDGCERCMLYAAGPSLRVLRSQARESARPEPGPRARDRTIRGGRRSCRMARV